MPSLAEGPPDTLWDFFIAHAGEDKAAAKHLSACFDRSTTVFWDGMLPAGVRWDERIPRQLETSAVIVLLISPHTADALYQREEIAIALDLVKRSPRQHRVVPVYLPSETWLRRPYGLTTANEIRMTATTTFRGVTDQLMRTLEDLRSPVAGPHETAAEALVVLAAWDRVARGVAAGDDPAFTRSLEKLLHVAIVAAGGPAAVPVLQRLRVLGLPARSVLRRLPGQAEAAAEWADTPLAGTTHVDPAVLDHLASTWEELLADYPLKGVSTEAHSLLISLLTSDDQRHEALSLVAARGVFARLLPARHGESRAVVPVPRQSDDAPPTPLGATAQEAGGPTADPGEIPAGARRRQGGGSAPTSVRNAAVHALAVSTTRLPPEDPFVTGRRQFVGAVQAQLAGVLSATATATAFFSGQPGVGSSTVAQMVARPLGTLFPGGVHYLDLHGLDPAECRTPRTAARILAEALGMSIGGITHDDEYFAAFRAGLAGRGVLIVLDNARDSSHVAWLAHPPQTCGLIVTSRDRMQDYATPSLVRHVPPLDRADSMRLLTGLTAGSGPADPAFDRIAELVGDLPLALRLIGARLAARPDTPAAYTAQLLADELTRLDYLEVGTRAVRAALQLSYTVLDDDARAAFRFLPAAPGRGVSGPELAYATQGAVARTELHLNRLVDRSLADSEFVGLREGLATAVFRLPELVHVFALERLGAEEEQSVADEVSRRCSAYVRDRLQETIASEDATRLEYELDAARPLAALRLATHRGWDDIAIDLAVALSILLNTQKDTEALHEVHGERIALYLRSGRIEDAVEAHLEHAARLQGDSQQRYMAAEALHEAAELAKSAGNVVLAATALLRLSLLLGKSEEWTASREAGGKAAELLLSAGKNRTAVPAVLNCCRLAAETGDSSGRLRWAEKAVSLASAYDTAERRAMALHELGLAQADHERHLEAMATFEASCEAFADAENYWNAANGASLAAMMADILMYAADRVRLLKTAVEHRQEAGNAPKLAAEVVALSAAYATTGKANEVSACLERAHRIIVGLEEEALDGFKYELALRRRALHLLHPDLAEDVAVPPPAGEPSLRQLAEAIGDHRRGAEPTDKTLATAEFLLGAPLLNQVEPGEFWLYEDLGEEPETAAALGS